MALAIGVSCDRVAEWNHPRPTTAQAAWQCCRDHVARICAETRLIVNPVWTTEEANLIIRACNPRVCDTLVTW